MLGIPDIPTAEKIRKKAVWYLCLWIGRPYCWGGDDPVAGFDCSGLIMEDLTAVGIYKRGGIDKTAHGIYLDFKYNEKPKIYAGCLVFWFNETGRASHVAMAIDDTFIVHASGGGKKIKFLKDAIRYNAFIKMDRFEEVVEFRKKKYNQDCKICDPFEVTNESP